LLLVSGWGLAVAAVGMLPTGPAGAAVRAAFVLAGVAVEILGMVLTIRSHLPPKSDKIPRGDGGRVAEDAE